METLTVLLALGFGAFAGYGIFSLLNRRRGQEQNLIRQESTILLERIEKVFKVVLAEGHFSEIYDYQSHKEYFYIFKVPRKALIVAKAKVLVGFDFGKIKLHWEDQQRRIIVEEMPPAEILSVDTDYQFYDIEHDILNPFTSKDYTQLLNEAKQTMHNKAIASELPKIALKQLHLLIGQLALGMGWQVEFRLDPAEQKQLTENVGFKREES